MSNSQIAKIIMAVNSISYALSLLNDAIEEGGDLASSLTPLMEKLKQCEADLNSIQSNT